MSKAEGGHSPEVKAESNIKSRARALLMKLHPDQLRSNDASHLISLLKELSAHPDDTENWSLDVRKNAPRGANVLFIAPGREPRSLPLRKPSTFLKMLEAFVETGEVPQELIDDESEGVRVSDIEREEVDENIKMFRDFISGATLFDELLGILMAINLHSRQNMRAGGIPQLFDAKAEELIGAEIATADTPDTLQVATTHVRGLEYFDPNVRERLESALSERASSSKSELLVPPSSIHEFESRAAAADTLDDLMKVAVEARTETFDTDAERRSVRRSIDTLAKNKFLEVCASSDTMDTYIDTMVKARQFPFSEDGYGQDVVGIIERNAKYFALSQIAKAGSPEALEETEKAARRFPFSDEHRRDLNDEVIKKRAGTADEAQEFPRDSRQALENQAFGNENEGGKPRRSPFRELLEKGFDTYFGR